MLVYVSNNVKEKRNTDVDVLTFLLHSDRKGTDPIDRPAGAGRSVFTGRPQQQAHQERRLPGPVGAPLLRLHPLPRHLPRRAGKDDRSGG